MASSTIFVFLFGVVSAMLLNVEAHPLMEDQYLDVAAGYEAPSYYYVFYEEPENDQEPIFRPRRSLQPDGSGGVYDNGSLRTEVSKDPQGNTNVVVGANGNIYRNGGRTVDAEAQWSKVINGPGRSKPAVRGSVTYRW